MIVGLIALARPEVWGNGYVVTNRILREEFLGEQAPLLFLCGLLLAKLLATAAAVGSGTVGGLFTPTLFLGAALGSIFGTLLHLLGQAEGLPTTAFALVGMASVLAATTHSPLLAMIMVFEISLDYSLVPALMLGCAVSIVVARKLHGESVYTEPLRLKGLEVARESGQPGVATARTVGELMRLPVAPVRETAKLSEVADRFLSSPNNFLPVVNEHQHLVGLVALQDMKPYLNEDADVGVIAQDFMRPPPACVTPNQSLVEALPVVLASEQRHIPVVNSLTEKRLVGSLVRAEVLGLLSEAISPGGKTDEAPRLV
jgi:CIC family chloride channel protein